jgi:carbamate kinase
MPERIAGSVVVAVGGNSVIDPASKRGNLDTHDLAREVCEEIATLARLFDSVVVTHGNGPQVGFELIRNEYASSLVPPDGMDVNVAATQGYLGYILQQVLGDVLEERNEEVPISSVITQVEVDPSDPGFQNPTKPVGPFYAAEEAARLEAERGWRMREDAGRGFRRVVPSPRPLKILELPAIRTLVEAGQIVICAGGGGVPVVRRGPRFEGIAAVIDKDLASALLASGLGASTFVISTGVPEVFVDYNRPGMRGIRRITAGELAGLRAQGHFAAGSMLPKIDATLDFIARGGSRVVITCPGSIVASLGGEAGTTVVP